MRATLFGLLLLLAIVRLSAQSPYTGSIPKVTTVSPNSAALFKAVDRPVGSFTGTTPIDIPLPVISSGSLSVPVSVNYSNGGIRVEEIASSVGLGWSLSAGGRITRVMNSLADDRRIGGDSGYLHFSVKPSFFPIAGWPYSNSLAGIENANQVLRGHKDAEPDLFFFSCNGLSGKFYFDESGNIHLVDQQQLSITPVWTTDMQEGYHIGGWVLRDAKGNKYYFGLNRTQSVSATDKATISYSGDYSTLPPSSFYTATWHLMEITDMNEESAIKFKYATCNPSFSTLSAGQMPISTWSSWGCQEEDNYSDVQFVENEATESYLTTIEGDNDSLVFYSSSRWDYAGGVKLDSMRLFAKNGAGIRKKFRFNYSYFGSGSPTTYYWRLKLNSLSEFGISGTDSSAYKFDYNETVNLPSHFSRGVDYWGYYNGQDYNWSFFPNGAYKNIYTIDPGNTAGDTLYINTFGDRRSNGDMAQANTLTKITWPTGGYRSFTYEGNKILADYTSQVAPDYTYYTFRDFDTTAFNTTNPYEPQYEHDFTVNSSEGAVRFNFYLDWNYIYSSNYTVKVIHMFDGSPGSEVMTFYNDVDGNVTLNNGDYRVIVEFDYFSNSFSGFYAYWTEQTLNHTTIDRYNNTCYRNNISAGGIRVKEVKDYDPATGKTHTTKYKYNLFSDSTLTSGLLISPVIVSHVGTQQEIHSCIYQRLSTSSSYPLSADGGAYVVYPEVRTIEEGNGYTDREFSFSYDGVTLDAIWPSGFSDFPIAPFPDSSWKRGKLVLERQHDNSGKLLQKSSTLGYGYHNSEWLSSTPFDDDDQQMKHFQLSNRLVAYWKHYYCDATTYPNMPPCGAWWTPFKLQSGFGGIKATKETVYGHGTTSSETLTENSYYTELGRPVLKSQTTYLSDGRKKVTHYNYAFNSSGSFRLGLTTPEIAMKDSLLALHYMEPLEIATYVKTGTDSSFVAGTKITYGSFNGTKKHPATLQQFTTLTDKSVLNFSRYDSYGNLLEQYKGKDVNEAYLWGYNHSYPVAKVIGSDYATIAALVNDAVLQQPANDIALQTELDKIRAALSGSKAQVTTYSYKPLSGMTSQTDAAGKTIAYIYDNFNRLTVIKDHDGNVIRKICYNYDGQPGNCSLYGNVAKSGNFVNNGCPSGGEPGPTVTYTVPADRYFALTQAEADAQAQADVDNLGQAWVNKSGNCGFYSTTQWFVYTRNNCDSGYVGARSAYILPNGSYSSTVSVDAANALAQADGLANGQNWVNEHGYCIPLRTLYYDDQTHGASVITIVYRNVYSGEEFYFYTNPSASGLTALGPIPEGEYEIEIVNPNSGWRWYDIGCSDYASGNGYAYCGYTIVDATCNSIIITN